MDESCFTLYFIWVSRDDRNREDFFKNQLAYDLRDLQSEGSSVRLRDEGGGPAAAAPPPWPGSLCAHSGSPPGWRITPSGSTRGRAELQSYGLMMHTDMYVGVDLCV